MGDVKITAVIPAYRRIDALLETLARLGACCPPPDEILVHVNGNEQATAEAVRSAFPEVTVFVSEENLGPGGARNRLVRAAAHPFVASFDDDSFPLDKDYFARLAHVFPDHPSASVIFAEVTEKNSAAPVFRADRPLWVADFVGCGCAYRRDDFLKLRGYVPLPSAYGCEEVDLALQLMEAGQRIFYHPALRVFHNTDMQHHASAAVNAASIRNLALLAFLRYPIRYWPLGLLQVLSRVRYLLGMKRFAGICFGLLSIGAHCVRYAAFRKPVSGKTIRAYRRLKTMPEEATP